jgi:hypothetical protein
MLDKTPQKHVILGTPARFTLAVSAVLPLITETLPVAEAARDSIKVESLTDEHGVFRVPPHGLRPIRFKRFRQQRDDDGGRRPAGAFRLAFPGCPWPDLSWPLQPLWLGAVCPGT